MRTIAIFISIIFSQMQGNCQSIIGHWERVNNGNQLVIITFSIEGEYSISIPGQTLDGIETLNEMHIPTTFKYEINNSVTPSTLDIISGASELTTKGLIMFIDDNSIQMQLNELPGGNYPEKIIPGSSDFYEFKRTHNINALDECKDIF